WFWWGREGAEKYEMLYRLLYDEMVRVKGVHNVIWVANADPDDGSWNPGEAYFDIISTDIYNPDYDYSSSSIAFNKLKALTSGKKMIALAENGPIPDMQQEVDDEAVWSWWMPWYQTWNGNFVNKTSTEQWRKCMNDSRVITLDDMPVWWGKTSASETTQNALMK
ncbi:MAG: glycoside hydrolase family 26 protein, partial [Bacteroidaceae bacterium]|nr:glycoside hydrolase family 26 protein [Bacteroidaceae bacterium]